MTLKQKSLTDLQRTSNIYSYIRLVFYRKQTIWTRIGKFWRNKDKKRSWIGMKDNVRDDHENWIAIRRINRKECKKIKKKIKNG